MSVLSHFTSAKVFSYQQVKIVHESLISMNKTGQPSGGGGNALSDIYLRVPIPSKGKAVHNYLFFLRGRAEGRITYPCMPLVSATVVTRKRSIVNNNLISMMFS